MEAPMPRPLQPLLLVAAFLSLGCDPQPTQPSEAAVDDGATPALAPTETAVAEFRYAPAFDPSNFVRNVDNRFFPLVPGTRYVYIGEEDGERETNVVVVTGD